ncbi:MAG TPA: PQQ-binding-like beta-propeller repeat protein [Gemmataceae bacterium]|nr:PQQ-binding-like beta-propeller repeat protein [Gemmataceae bacterium]
MRRTLLLVALCWGTTIDGQAAEPKDLPAADPTTTVEKLNLGPTRLYVHWTGKAKDFRFFRQNAGYYVAEDFSFTFASDDHGDWPLISREPTPFETWRFGTTYTGLDVDWSKQPRVRVLGVKTIDRLPAKFQDYKLDADRIITALIVEVERDGRWVPWYVNNWFHKWGTPADAALIVSHYVDRPSPTFDVYGFKGDITADLTEKSKKLVEKYPNWRAYHGRVVKDAGGKHGWGLELIHVFVKNDKSGGHDAVPDEKGLVLLTQEAPVGWGRGWPMIYNGPHHPNAADSELPPPLKVKWTFKGDKEFAGSPVVAGGRVFIGNNDRKLYCVEAATGNKLWDFATGDQVESTPAVAGDGVVFGSFDGKVYCLDAATGKKRWDFATGPRIAGFPGIDDVKQGIDSSAAVVDGRVYFGAWDGKAYCLDLKTGKLVWSAQAKGPVHYGSPAVAGGRVYLGTADGTLHCWDAKDGKVVWEKALAGKHSDHMMSSPAVHDGTVYVGSGYDGPLLALDAKDGKEVWRFGMKNLVCGAPTVRGGHVCVFGDGGGQVVCVDAKKGTQVWETRLGKGWGGGSPVASGKYLYLTLREGSVDGKAAGVVALDAATGKAVWSAATGPAWGTCAIADGVLYYGSDDGKLYALAWE